MAVLGLVKPAELADGTNPAVHFLFRLRHQVEGPLCRFDIEHEAVLELLSFEGETGIHLLAAVQVYDADGLLGMVTLIVLQNIWVSAHASTAEDKPALLPGLRNTKAADPRVNIENSEPENLRVKELDGRKGRFNSQKHLKRKKNKCRHKYIKNNSTCLQ